MLFKTEYFYLRFMEKLVSPQYLNKGDTIGIFAPARAVTEAEMEPFVTAMTGSGYKVLYGKNLFGSIRQFSGTAEERRSDLNELFLNEDVKAVFAARGGYGAAQLLPGIDWEIIRENPKWLIGFSDVTALHSAFGKFMETIHGMMPYSMVMEVPQDEVSFSRLIAVLEGKQVSYEIKDHPLNNNGVACGALTGGNLSVLASLAGTPFEPDYEGKILFLEDLDEYLYHIDRMILNMELRGVFRKISGLIVGDFSDMHDNVVPFGLNAFEIIAEKASRNSVPTLFGFPSGHKKTNLPQIFGRVSTLTVDGNRNSLRMY